MTIFSVYKTFQLKYNKINCVKSTVGFVISLFELEEPNFRQIEIGNEEQLMVFWKYMLYESEKEVYADMRERNKNMKQRNVKKKQVHYYWLRQ